MSIRPNAFGDDHRVRALSVTLKLTMDQVNTAFAAYAPRDTAEAAMVEQVLRCECSEPHSPSRRRLDCRSCCGHTS